MTQGAPITIPMEKCVNNNVLERANLTRCWKLSPGPVMLGMGAAHLPDTGELMPRMDDSCHRLEQSFPKFGKISVDEEGGKHITLAKDITCLPVLRVELSRRPLWAPLLVLLTLGIHQRWQNTAGSTAALESLLFDSGAQHKTSKL